MNDDLISRKALLEEINSDENKRADALMCEWYADMVSRQPAAYNLYKVVKQIRNIPHGAPLNVKLKEEIVGIIKSGGIE